MKIKEIALVPIKQEDTKSSATISSAIKGSQTQDIVPQDIVPQNDLALEVDSIEEHDDHSAITEGVSQILRRQKVVLRSKDSDVLQVRGKAESWPSQVPVSRRQTRKGLRRSERRDRSRPLKQVRNWHRPNGQEQVQED